jgi:hypothetical protein
MKVLYLIQTFKNLPQISRLVRTIKQSSPEAAVLISHNRETFTIDPSVFQDLSDVHVMHVENINRADFRMMQAYLDGIDHARNLKIDFDWVVNLTGQCYPARPLSEFEQRLATTSYDGFMESCEVFVLGKDNPWDRWEGPRQYKFQYYWQLSAHDLPPLLRKALSIPRRIANNIQPFFRVDTSYGLHVGVRGRSDIFNDQFKLYGGQYWKTLSRRAVDYLCEFAKQNKDIVDYFRYTLIPVEVFPQTVLLNNPDFSFSNENYYYIRFDGTKLRRPRILTANDYNTIVERNVFFGRKFEPSVDSHVLDMLDARLFGNTYNTVEPLKELVLAAV